MKHVILTMAFLTSLSAFANAQVSDKDVQVAQCISSLIPAIPDGNAAAHANPAVMKNYTKLCTELVELELSKDARVLECIASLIPAIPDRNTAAHANPAVMKNYSQLCEKIVDLGQ